MKRIAAPEEPRSQPHGRGGACIARSATRVWRQLGELKFTCSRSNCLNRGPETISGRSNGCARSIVGAATIACRSKLGPRPRWKEWRCPVSHYPVATKAKKTTAAFGHGRFSRAEIRPTKRLEGDLGYPSRPRRGSTCARVVPVTTTTAYSAAAHLQAQFCCSSRCHSTFPGTIGLRRLSSLHRRFASPCAVRITRFFAARALSPASGWARDFSRSQTPCTFRLRRPPDPQHPLAFPVARTADDELPPSPSGPTAPPKSHRTAAVLARTAPPACPLRLTRLTTRNTFDWLHPDLSAGSGHSFTQLALGL